jgi:diguanylate cyclase (GGDEF)-like protein/PAS domain S-box-containing protein
LTTNNGRSRIAYFGAVAAMAATYWALGYAGLSLGAALNAFASTIWPASGLALAVLLLFGTRYWPAVFIGALLVNAQAGASLPVAALIGVGNSAEALLAASLVRRFVGHEFRLDRVRDVVGLVLLGAIVATLAGATIGTMALWGGDAAGAARLSRVWLHWWVGDMVGVLVVTPFVLAFGEREGRPRSGLRIAEAALLLVVAAVLSAMIFGPAFLSLSRTSLTFLLLPPIVWAALRFEARGATAISLLVGAAATLGTLRGLGPFSQVALEESVLLLALFIGVVATTGLVLAASSAESRQTSGLREGLDLLRRVFDVMPVGVSVADRSGRITSANPAAERIGVDTVAGHAPHARDVASDKTYAGRDWPLLRALATNETIAEKRIDVRTPDGRQLNLLSSAAPIRDAAGRTVGAVAVHHDVTALLAAQQRVQRLGRARTVMALCNQTLIHATSETQMLADMCRIVVENGGHRAAWIGFAEHDAEKRVRPVASAGLPLEEIESLGITWGDGPRGDGVTGAAIRSGKPDIVHDYLAHSRLAPWRAFALRHGMRSVLGLPLNTSAECLGALVIYADEPDVFDADEIELLNELAGDIAFGIEALRARLQRALAETELANKNEVLRTTFESMDQGIVVLDRELRIMARNRRYQTLLELPDSLFADPGIGLADTLRFIAARGEFGPGRPDELVRERIEVARLPAPYRIERERPDGTVLDIRSAPLPGGGRVTTYTDITERKRAEQAVKAAEANLVGLLNAISEAVFLLDTDGRVLFANDAIAARLGTTTAEMTGRSIYDLVPPELAAYRRQMVEQVIATGKPIFRMHDRRDDHVLDNYLYPVFGADGKVARVAVFSADITEREAAMRALRESEELFRQLAGNIPEFFWVRDAASKDRFLYFSPAWSKITGWPAPTDVQGMLDIVHPQDYRRVVMGAAAAPLGGVDQEHRIVRPDGEVRWLRVRTFPIHDAAGEVYRVAGVGEDISERKADQERLLQMAHFDRLTNLPNRTLLYDSLQRTLERAHAERSIVAVLFIDLDRFKVVNDTLGHAIGDALLQRVALRLTDCVRIRDTVGRLGGDEFALILPALESAEASGAVADKLLHALALPFDLEQHEVFVTASIGITLFPGDAADADTLLRYADTAMYQAKQEGRNAYRYFTPELNARAAERLELENSLRRALERGEFLLHYQPKLDLRRNEICGVEALLRWRRPGRELVPPAEFIPLLEETGLIVEVGDWVVDEACRQLGAWQREGADPIPIAINLSPRQFRAKDLAARIRRAMREHGVRARMLECEITESSVMADPEHAVGVLDELKAAGIALSVDDFGTGYSSLSYLRRFPIDELKIDRSFVRDVATDPNDAAIARAIISMAHRLGLKVVAEGVENAEQLEFLRANDCDEVQGYFIARPAGAAEILPLLHKPGPR